MGSATPTPVTGDRGTTISVARESVAPDLVYADVHNS